MNISELELMVKNMKIKDDSKKKDEIIELIQEEKSLTTKCILARMYLSPQSTNMETIIRNDLLIRKPKDKLSGDGCKNDINYEIKFSGHAKGCKVNFVQIRPDHNVDYYLFICYNMYYDIKLGKGFIFKIPSDVVYDLIVKYGGYAHGTCKKLGSITKENIKGRNCEYALRCNPNSTKGKGFDLWNEMLKYEVEYEAENF